MPSRTGSADSDPSCATGCHVACRQVSDRFQSYNVEMVEVTGGRFWKPYDEVDAQRASAPQGGNQPTGVDPSLLQYRPAIDLASAKLRKLAAALGPAYVRVSGTWQNTTYFHNSDVPAPFSGVSKGG